MWVFCLITMILVISDTVKYIVTSNFIQIEKVNNMRIVTNYLFMFYLRRIL